MASPNVYVPGGTSGARLATRSPVFMSGSYWYVSPTGLDAGGTAGRNRTRPLLTIAQAITNASAGDTIQLIGGGTYTIAASLAVNKAGLKLQSEGTELTRAKLAISTANPVLAISAAGVWVENITFNIPGAGGSSHAAVTAASVLFHSCRFECDAFLSGRSVQLGAGSSNARLKNCTFVSQGSGASSVPAIGLEIAAAISDVELDTVIFEGGTYGWSDYALKATAAVTRLNGIDVDFLNDSDLQLATGSVYAFHRRDGGTGSTRMEFVA